GAFPVVRVREAVLASHQEFPVRQQCHAVPIPSRSAPGDGRPFHDRGGRAVACPTIPSHGRHRLRAAGVTRRHSAGVTAYEELLQCRLDANYRHASTNEVNLGASAATTCLTCWSVGLVCTACSRSPFS